MRLQETGDGEIESRIAAYELAYRMQSAAPEKQRGLLDETLVIWGGEFGRTPMNEVRRGNSPGKEGRDHHPFAFTMLLAGGGIQGGQVVGETDELGYHPTKDPIHVHDLQATILHCLGMDHEQLTFRHQGRDFRLTDVGCSVVQKLLA